jgi:hypothetical protein
MSIKNTPSLKIKKLGIVSRDYRYKFSNGYRDFSSSLPNVLKMLDDKKCDAVLFSLYSIVPREGVNIYTAFANLINIKSIFVEEFNDGNPREVKRFVVFHNDSIKWEEYELHQKFATLTGMDEKDTFNFVATEMPKRVLGNCVVLLCGESNGVKYSKSDKSIHDTYGLAGAIPKEVNIVLNPVHDRMTRFEMNLKREFLSRNNRWVISVWNKGKQDKNGRIKDGFDAAWTVYNNGERKIVEPISNNFNLEIGILDIGNN